MLESDKQLPGYSGYNERKYWIKQALYGWMDKPILGHGVQAFRIKYGTTSHSTPIDLLYNYGVIGFFLFYSIFVSIFIRIYCTKSYKFNIINISIFGFLVSYFLAKLILHLTYL